MPVTYDALIVDVDGRVATHGHRVGAVQGASPAGREQHRQQRLPGDPRRHERETCSPRRFPADACTNFGPLPSMPGARAGRSRRDRWLLPAGARRLARKRRRRDRVRARAGPLPASDRSRRRTSPASTPRTTFRTATRCSLSAVLDPDGTAMTLFTAGPDHAAAAGRASRRARWSRCRRTGTDGTAEGFLVYDITSHTLVTQREVAAPLLVRDRGRLPARSQRPQRRPRPRRSRRTSGPPRRRPGSCTSGSCSATAAAVSTSRKPRSTSSDRAPGAGRHRRDGEREPRRPPQALRASSRQLWYAASSPRLCAHSDSRS